MKKGRTKRTGWKQIIFLIVFAVALFISSKTIEITMAPKRCSVETTATVIDYTKHTDSNGEEMYSLLLSFHALDDNGNYTEIIANSLNKIYYKAAIGDIKSVRYNPSDPYEVICLDNYYLTQVLITITFMLGMVFLVLALISVIKLLAYNAAIISLFTIAGIKRQPNSVNKPIKYKDTQDQSKIRQDYFNNNFPNQFK